MKIQNIKQLLKKNNKSIATAAAITVLFMNNPAYAQVLDKAKKALEALQKDLIGNIIPIAAAVILLCLAIGYAGRYIGRDTFVRWAIGVVIAGSATELVAMLFKP
ncbi:VirB2 family type IV secretion system major pilin TrwL [Bartonella taylorii]|uniref:VirB2 family type IV secretion system major pilin TrwL n=2 Tax=Bartonella TaxID=773 RepID=UPI001ABB38B1|nr:VirB2 family type IV secretion system major pilin TrwL [Bartonella taylorii]USP01191.1 VirB2 family type IV secretion system major pilin TrwL [Bartonella taylorii]